MLTILVVLPNRNGPLIQNNNLHFFPNNPYKYIY